MNILIMENDLNDLIHLKQLLTDYFSKIEEIAPKFKVCVNESELLLNIKTADLLFLDIELGSMNGIQLGVKLKNIKHDCKIIITSYYQTYLIDGYKINAFRYLLKPLEKNFFSLEMDDILNVYLQKYQGFFDENIKKGKIYYRNIIYIEKYDRKTLVHFENGENYYSNKSLKEWINILSEQPFSQCYRSIIVNLEYISGFDKENIYLLNNVNLPLSKHYKNIFKEEYLTYKI